MASRNRCSRSAGNFGSALGPLLAAFFVLPRGQNGLAWFALAALAGMVILTGARSWYQRNGHARRARKARRRTAPRRSRRARCRSAMAMLIALLFSKYIYLASITSYYIFYLMRPFRADDASRADLPFVFFAAVAAGTVAGGPIGDRLGRKIVIWVSILGVLPFTLALPYVGLELTIVLSVVIGFILSSAFPAIVVYATGTDAGPRRHGLRPVLRSGLRHRRHGRGGARRVGGLDGHRLRL